MTELMDNNRLIELVIEKHNRFIETFNNEFSELDNKLNDIRQQSDARKKEMETKEARITVLNEKYHLLFHQAKKQREEIFGQVIERMKTTNGPVAHDLMRLCGRMEEFEKRLQNSKNIDDEDKFIVEMKKLFYDFESAARKAGTVVESKRIIDKLNEANSSHRELVSLQDKPKENIISPRDSEIQIGEIEGRHNWLKRRIESHRNALSYWEKQKGG